MERITFYNMVRRGDFYITSVYHGKSYKTYIMSDYYTKKALVCNEIKKLFGIKFLPLEGISINGITYAGYELPNSTEICTLKDVGFVSDRILSEIRKIFVYRYVIGATLDEKKILVCGGDAVSWGETRINLEKCTIPPILERKWFRDVTIGEFAKTMNIIPSLIRGSIDDIIQQIDNELIYFSDSIERNILSLECS